MEQVVYVVDTYTPYMKNEGVKKVFNYNGREYAIKEVELEWGTPQLNLPIDDTTDPATGFYLYNSFEEANRFVEELIGAKL